MKNTKLWIILAILIGAGVYAYQNLGSVITREAEQIASDALGVKVNIGSIHVDLADKTVTVNTIEISNPPGFSSHYAMTAKSIDIVLKAASSDLIDFKDIMVNGTVVNLEVNEHGMNLRTLENMANGKKEKSATGSKQVRVILEHMVVGASTVNPSISLFSNGASAPMQLPPITVAGTGNTDAGDAVVHVLGGYLNAVIAKVQSSGLLNHVPSTKDVKDNIGGAVGSMKKLF